MAKVVENITNPGQPLAHGDRYHVVNDNGTFTAHRFSSVKIPSKGIRKITTQAFYRRMTQGERTSMRAASPVVADLREDLARSSLVNLDGSIESQLQSVSVFNQTRIDALLDDGTLEEAHSGN